MTVDLVQWLVDNEPEFRKSRLPSLYSDLGQLKSSNPDGFAANATAWQAALKRAALAGQLPTEQKIILRTSEQLLEAFRSPQYGEPTGLGLVLDAAIREGKMMDLSTFSGAEQSIYQKRWIPSPTAIFHWTLRQAGLLNSGSYDQNGRLKPGQLVLINNLEQLERQVLALQAMKGQAPTDRIMSRDAFAQLLSETQIGALAEQELEVFLRFLNRDKQILSYDANTVKFKAPSTTLPAPITQEDSTIASMKALIASLESSTASLVSKIAGLHTTAQAAVQSKNRNSALAALRSKKRAEQALESRSATLHQLEDVYAKIEQAIDQVQLVAIMESSAKTLKSLNKQIGGVDRVDTVMDDLREQMGQVDEVGKVLQEPLDAGAGIDETEIDDELEALEKEEHAREEEIKADATREKLGELEKADEALRGKAELTKASDVEVEAQVSRSTQQLERMHLEVT